MYMFFHARRATSVLAIALGIYCFGAFIFASSSATADEPTRKQKSEVRKINELILKAGRLYKSKNFPSSAKSIKDAQGRLERISAGADKELLALLEPEFKRLQIAHKLLAESGEKLDDLKPLPAPAKDANAAVSFKTEVAPFLVARCGRCHVDRNRGSFSAASYDALGQSTMVAVGIPADSRLIQVIEDGEMPPGGSVPDEVLAMLKRWITEGAKFDGDAPTTNLKELTNVVRGNRNQPVVNVVAPTGKETVSFGLHVAPILIENCAQCHISDDRGNLEMQNFASLLRGGDSGSPISPKSGMNSLLIHRLTATNGQSVMPPSGKISDAQIDVIRKWIDEGATFDGADPGLAIQTVAAVRKAASQSHEQLVEDRRKKSEANWKLAMSDIAADQVQTDNFFLFGSNGEGELEEIGEMAEKLLPKIQSSLKVAEDPTFIKGNSSIFVFQRHYDFSEFGTMIISHPLPKEVKGYWGYTTIDAFSSVLLKRGKTPEDIRVSLAQQLASLRVANMSPDIPRWFADGLGHWVAARILPRDEEPKGWDDQARAVMSNMQKPDDFLSGKLPEHQAALVAYMFVKQLRSDTGKFSRLLRSLRENKPFEKAFLEAYGATPQTMFGSDTNRSRRRRNR